MKLQPGRIQTGESARTQWVATAETGTTKEQILDPSYWSNFSSRFKPYDHVEVRMDDGTFWGLYLILSCDRAWARIHPIIEVNLTTPDVAESQASHEIGYAGPHHKYRVVRLSDKEVVKHGFETKKEAQEWLEDHLKVS